SLRSSWGLIPLTTMIRKICPCRLCRFARKYSADALTRFGTVGNPRQHMSDEELMSQAIVDPLELKRFAHHLKQFNGDLRERLSGLHAEMTRLGDTWRDQEHVKFTEEFEQTLHVIEHFLEVADQHIPFLMRKAERIEEYLSQH